LRTAPVLPFRAEIRRSRISRELPGTWVAISSYSQPNAAYGAYVESHEAERLRIETMKEATDVLRIVGIILLGIFVLVVGIPLVFAAAGITLGIIGILFGIAVMLIKLAVVIAICYLILVGIRAVIR
jgi:hypothetical protein